MDYVTKYYKNLSEQLQQRVDILTSKVKYLTEVQDPDYPTPQPPLSKPGRTPSPYTPFSAPETEPLPPSPTPRPYRGPGQVKPGDYSPAPPPNAEEWSTNNPPPNPDNYPDGVNDPQFLEDAREWLRLREQWQKSWKRWARERAGGAGQYLLPGAYPEQGGSGYYPAIPSNWPMEIFL